MAGENLQERRKLAKTYALAMYDLAAEQGVLDAVRDQWKIWIDLLRQDPALILFFDSVVVTAEDRQRFLDQVDENFHPLLVKFLSVMNRRNRLGILPEMMDAFRDEDDLRNQRIRVKLTTAVPIDPALTQEIRQWLQKYLGKEPILEPRVKPDILGGFIALADDVLIDGSIKTRLATLQKNLLRRGEDEIQSRRDFIGN